MTKPFTQWRCTRINDRNFKKSKLTISVKWHFRYFYWGDVSQIYQPPREAWSLLKPPYCNLKRLTLKRRNSILGPFIVSFTRLLRHYILTRHCNQLLHFEYWSLAEFALGKEKRMPVKSTIDREFAPTRILHERTVKYHTWHSYLVA